VSGDWTQRTTDPDGRLVVFDATSHLHLAGGARSWLLGHVDVILGAIEVPDFREDDPLPGRERFYRSEFPGPDRWLRVIVDFNDTPGWVVTALDQENDPRPNP
jgi:hypothetical protein